VKVLLLHQHFNTPAKGGAIRSYYLAKALVDAGIHVIVVTAHSGNTYKVETVEGIEVHFLAIPYDNRYGFYKRSISFLQYVWRTIVLAGKFRDADYCYAMSVPLTVGIAAMVIRWLYRIPFIFEVGDLWPEAPVQLGYIKNAWFKKALYYLEKKIYRQARAIVALSTAIRSHIEQRISGKSIHLIPNMSDIDFFRVQPKNEVLQRAFKVENKFVVSYIGAIGMANGLGHFLRCAKASKTAGLPVRFLLCGEGALLGSLRQIIIEEGLDNLTIVPFQNRDGVRDVLKITDATFISYQPVPILETGSPNKYFDGLAAGKLIVINFGGWIREEIEANRCGIYVGQDDGEDFVKKITPFLYSEKLVKQYQQSSRAVAESSYSRKMLSERFVKLFQAN
jgi:glycosyltransferase involved in cell wall biosynthesis